jgi:cell division protease FtsH
MPDIDPVYKVTILPRGRTGGHTLSVPEDDKELMTRSEMIARLVFALGGRAAEELVFHEPTTGASNDIEQATKIARAMVTEYGMSARLGAVKYGQHEGEPFLGRQMSHAPDYSLEVAHEIDEEVRALIEAAHDEAWNVLNDYRDALDALVLELIERETLQRTDLERIFSRVDKRPRITKFNDFGGRTPSDKPPVKTPAELAKERGEPWPPHAEPEPTPVGAVPGGQDTPGGPPHVTPEPPGPNGRDPHAGHDQQQPSGQPDGQSYPPTVHLPGSAQRGNAAGPPNYDAPPGWKPATVPSGQQGWSPSWDRPAEPEQGGQRDRDAKNEQEAARRSIDTDRDRR